jgi:excisionase family DNA binding protein
MANSENVTELPWEPYLTKEEVAAYLNATPRFVNLALAEGSLKSYRPRRNFLRFRREDIDDWMRRQAETKENQPVA